MLPIIPSLRVGGEGRTLRTEAQSAADAYLICTNDLALQAYLQTYPNLTGPDEALNRQGLALLRAGPAIRRPKANVQVNLLDREDFSATETAKRIVLDLCMAAQIDEPDALIDDFHWKIAVAQALPDRILSFGCGEGDELLMLRTLFPTAQIKAIDWSAKVSSKLLAATQVSFQKLNLITALSSEERYDLIFSNHTLEHFYDPDEILGKLRAMLTPGGALVCAMPLDGSPDDVFRGPLSRWAAAPARIRPLDAPWLDAGHPWKANAADVYDTLKRAGFGDVQIYQRASNIPRGRRFNEQELRRYRRRFGRLYDLTLRPFNAAMGSLGDVLLIRRAVLGLEAKLPWGGAQVKNSQTREIAFVARAPHT